MLRAAEAEAQAEAARALIGADMGPNVNSATSPVHGARNHKGCPAVAKRKAPDLFVQVRGSETLDINYSHSMASVLPSRHSSYTQFSASTRNACRRMTRCRVSSASGTKVGTTSKNFFQTQGFEFLFLSQGARRAAFGGSISPKTPVLKLNRL